MEPRILVQFHRMHTAIRRVVASQETGLVVVLAIVTITLTLLAGSHPDRVTGAITNNFWNRCGGRKSTSPSPTIC